MRVKSPWRAYLDLYFRVTEKRGSNKVFDALKKEYRGTSTAHRGQHKAQRGMGVLVGVDIENFMRSAEAFAPSRQWILSPTDSWPCSTRRRWSATASTFAGACPCKSASRSYTEVPLSDIEPYAGCSCGRDSVAATEYPHFVPSGGLLARRAEQTDAGDGDGNAARLAAGVRACLHKSTTLIDVP